MIFALNVYKKESLKKQQNYNISYTLQYVNTNYLLTRPYLYSIFSIHFCPQINVRHDSCQQILIQSLENIFINKIINVIHNKSRVVIDVFGWARTSQTSEGGRPN